MLEFINNPSYSIGDDFTVESESSNSSGSGSDYYSYSYHQYDDHSTENYQYGDNNNNASEATVHRESFHYYSDPSTGTIGDISQYLDLEVYDSSQRQTTRDSLSIHQYNWGGETRSSTYTYTYIDSTSAKLLSSTEIYESSYTSSDDNYTDFRTENITYTYDYSGLRDSEIYGEYDFSTRWGVGTSTFENSYGDDELFTIYKKETQNRSNSSDSREEFKIETTESGFIVNTQYYENENSRNGYSHVSMNTRDYDQDGIIDSTYEHSSRSKGDRFMNQSLDMQDNDGDGQADYIYMSQERGSRSGTKRTEYRYDTQSANRPILEITKFRDGNVTSENAVFRTLTSDYTEMGGHILEMTDVLA